MADAGLIFDMDEKTLNAEYAGSGEGRSLPKLMDPVMTMAAVQRYVEQERVRSRRLFVWTSTVFLFVVVFVLAAFVSIGIYVMRHIRHSREELTSMQVQTALQSAEVLVISNSMNRIEDSTVQITSEVRNQEAARAMERKMLQEDLKRFSEWVTGRSSGSVESMADVVRRMQQIEKDQAERGREVASLREQNAALLLAVVKGSATAPDDGSRRAEPAGAAGDTAQVSAESVEEGRIAVHAPPVRPEAGSTGTAAATPLETATAAVSVSPETRISVVSYPNGDRYEGEFKNGLLDGWGVYYYRNGDRYEGEFRADMKCGKGTLVYASGDRYVGAFDKDMRWGDGSITYGNGDKFVGDFRDDTMNGKGTVTYANGNQYAGDFKNGLKHGSGAFKYAKGDSYVGEFAGDCRNGHGTYAFANGARYVGQFKDDRREGKGRYIYANGEEYVGEFKNGMKHGYGLCKYPDGTQVKGVWKEDRFLHALED
jgi:hypothetical protein